MRIIILALLLCMPAVCLAGACDDAKKTEAETKKACDAARKTSDNGAQVVACARYAAAMVDRQVACRPQPKVS